MLSLRQPPPDFSLPDLQGNLHTLRAYIGKIVALNFWSAECPWAETADKALAEYSAAWGEQVVILTIAANANEPLELIRSVASARGLGIVLLDAGAKIADLFVAQTTPHLFLLDKQGLLRYQGALNDITFRQRVATKHYFREAVNALLTGHFLKVAETPAYGCTIVRNL